MTCYVVIFELKDVSRLPAVKEELKSYGYFCPLTARSWAIKTEMTAAELRDKLAPVVGQGSRLFVIRSGTEAAWRNSYGEKHNEWLKKNL